MYVVPALTMPGMSEWMVILVIVLIIFGPGRLPEVFNALGKGMKSFKDAQKDLNQPTDGATDVTPPKALPKDDVQDAAEVRQKATSDRT